MFPVALNQYRSAMRRRLPPAVELDGLDLLIAEDRSVELDSDLRADVVRRAVATLPPKYRDVIVLYYFHEMDLAETARTFRLREDTVKARLFRDRKLLQDKLAGMMCRPSLATEEA